MITWIQLTLYKHMRIIFSVLLVFIICAFVFFTGRTSRMGGMHHEEKEFYGYDLNDRHVLQMMNQNGNLSYRIMVSPQVRDDAFFRDYCKFRMAMLSYADRLGIPNPSESEFQKFIKGLPAFRGENGQFSAERYNQYLLMLRQSFVDSFIMSVLEEDFRINAAQRIFIGPIYSQPFELETLVSASASEYALKLVRLDESDVSFSFVENEEQIKSFYEKNKSLYQIPAKSKIAYIHFPMETAEPQLVALTNYFAKNKAILLPAVKAARPEMTDEALATITPNEAVEIIHDKVLEEYQKRKTEEAAYNFYSSLSSQTLHDPKAFEEKLAASHLKLERLAPYSSSDIPADTVLSREILEQALEMDNNTSSGQMPVSDGFVILIKEGEVAARVPELNEVREAVIAGLKAEERMKNFVAKGEELKKALQADIDAKKAMDETVVAAKAVIKDFPAFKITSPGENFPRVMGEHVIASPIGKVSAMTIDGDKGYFVVVEKRTPPSAEALAKDVASYEPSMNMRLYYSYVEGIQKEILARGDHVLPEEVK